MIDQNVLVRLLQVIATIIIRRAFDVGTQQLARLRKVVQEQSSRPFLKVAKEKVCCYSDVVLPRGGEEPVSMWLRSQQEGGIVICRNKQERHGNAGKRSNHAKSEAVIEKFLNFVDSNSSPNGCKEGSHGTTYYFTPKFSLMRTPNLDDPQ